MNQTARVTILIAVLSLFAVGTRMPSIITSGCSEDWRDAWIWEPINHPAALCPTDVVTEQGQTLRADVENPSKHRWTIWLKREFIVCLVFGALFVLTGPLRERTLRTMSRVRSDAERYVGIFTLGCLATITLFPPCIDPPEYRYLRPEHSYHALWDMGTSNVDFKLVVLEIVAAFAVSGLLLLIFRKSKI